MFTSLLNALKSVWNWFAWVFNEIWRQSCSVVWSVWSVVLVVVGMVTAFLDWLQVAVDKIVQVIGDLALPTFDLSCSGASDYLALANTLFPLSELFAFLIAYATMLGLLLLYKGAKSLKSWFWAS